MDLGGSWDYLGEVSSHRLNNNKTERHVSKFGEEIELLGAAGELAARRFLKLPETLHEHFDSGADFHWHGWRVDVKATHLTRRINHRFLQWPHWKRVKADIVIMTGVNLETQQAEVLGWCWRRDILRAPINIERDTPCHEIPIPELRPAWELFELGRNRRPARRRTYRPVPA